MAKKTPAPWRRRERDVEEGRLVTAGSIHAAIEGSCGRGMSGAILGLGIILALGLAAIVATLALLDAVR